MTYFKWQCCKLLPSLIFQVTLLASDTVTSDEASCCSAWLYNRCIACTYSRQSVVKVTNWCFSSFLPLLCFVCRQACYMPSVMPAICYHHGGVYYAYHIDYCEVYLNGGGMHGKNVLNYPLPASYSVIEPVLACHICSHCCINWKLLRVIFLYLSLYFYLFACYTTAIRAT